MKKFLSLLLAVIMVMSLVACGGKNDTANTGKTNDAGKTETPKAPTTQMDKGESTKVEVTQDEKAEYAKEITLALGLADLDPGVSWNATRESYMRLVYDNLIWYDDVTGETEMQLAKSVEWTDDTCTRIHVVLRDDIVFSNGEKLTAADCEFSFARNTYNIMVTYYDSCEIVNDYEFYINLKTPCAAFIPVLSRAATCVVCKSEAEKHPDGLALIGSGPYVYDMDTYVAASSITLNRNEKFWGEQNPTEKIHLVKMSDASASAIALQNGEIDYMIGANANELPALEAKEGLTVHKYNSYNFIHLGFNDKDDSAALTEEEKNFRRAVACCINKDDIVAGLGGGMVMVSQWPYDHEAYIANESDYEHDHSYNPEKAKEYLAKAGGKTEFTILADTSRSWVKLAAQVIQENCRQVGITMNLEETDSTGFSSMTKYGQLEYDGTLWSNLFVVEPVNTGYFKSGSNVNRATQNDPEIEAALAAAGAMANEFDRAEQYRIVQRECHDNVSWLPLVWREMNIVYRTGLEGFYITPSPTYNYRNIRLRTN